MIAFKRKLIRAVGLAMAGYYVLTGEPIGALTFIAVALIAHGSMPPPPDPDDEYFDNAIKAAQANQPKGE